MDGPDPDGGNAALAGAERWLAEWTSSANARADATRQLAERVRELTGEASALDGAVRVTVAGDGRVVDLQLAERAGRHPMADVGRAVLVAMRAAQATRLDQVRAAAEDTVGVDSAEGQAVTASFARRFPRADLPADGR